VPRFNGFTAYDPHFHGSEFTPEEVEFMLAVRAYQTRFGRRYPTWREVLHVLRCLGYRKVADPVPVGAPEPPEGDPPCYSPAS
jgi:hypothetical protein